MPFDVLGEELNKCGQASPDLRAFFMLQSFTERYFRLGDLEVNQLGTATWVTIHWGFQTQVSDAVKHFTEWPHSMRACMSSARPEDDTELREATRDPGKKAGGEPSAPATNAALEGRIPESIDPRT
jgi:hypothetical protein